MSESLAEQVAGFKVGDWAIAEFYDAENGNKWGVEGNVYSGAGDSLIIGNDVILFHRGNIDPNLTSIARVPRPIPQEPEVGERVVAYLRLGEGGEDSVDEFMRYTDESSIPDQYISINHGDKAKWSDLLNPEMVSR